MHSYATVDNNYDNEAFNSASVYVNQKSYLRCKRATPVIPVLAAL